MKILYITVLSPLPLNEGSKLRAYHLLKSYALHHEVTLVCFAQDEEKTEDIVNLNNLCKEVHRIPARAAPYFNFSRKFKSVGKLFRYFSLTPYIANSLRSQEMIKTIKEELREGDYDVIHLNRLFMASNILDILKETNKKHYKIIDVDDLESQRVFRLAKIESLFSMRKYHNYIESLKFFFYEKRMLKLFDVCLVCSKKDQEILLNKGISGTIEIIPNGVNISSDIPEEKPGGAREDPVILYLGTMSYKPNEDAALYFANEIFPLIKRELPSSRYVIAGASPGEKIRALHNGTDITVTGYVEDVRQQYAECTISIAPIRAGGGTRIKILEAMSAGKAVVSTSLGCEGIEVADGENILIADRPRDFAARCVELLSDEAKRKHIGLKGRELVMDNYLWLSIGKKIYHIAESALKK